METNIKNAQLELPLKNRLFSTKEEYLAMRQAWKDYHNQGHAKGEWVETTHRVRDWSTNTVVEYINKRKVTPLDGMHYILYNLLRGLPAHRGFMQDWTQPTDGYASEYVGLEPMLGEATEELVFGDDSSESYMKWKKERKEKVFQELTKPFGDAVTAENLATVLKLIEEGHYRNLLEDEEAA